MRRRPQLPTLPVPRASRRVVVGLLVAVAVLVPGWMWLRDSPLVGVDEVTVTGLSGPQAATVRQALESAARDMTTLNVDEQALEDAVRRFPIVGEIRADGRPLHRLDIEVEQRAPVAALVNGDARMAVAADGTILVGTLTKDLPLVPVSSPPGGRTLAEPEALRLVRLLGAAPAELRGRIAGVELGDRGLQARIADGPELFFGPAGRLEAKWAAATRVLADASSRGAAYLDLRVPERPAAGGLEPSEPPPPSAGAPVDPAEPQPDVEVGL